MSLQDTLIPVRHSAIWLLSALVCIGVSGCRKESSSDASAPAESVHTETPAEPSSPAAPKTTPPVPDPTPTNDAPRAAEQPPAVAKVTILSTKPIPPGAAGVESGLPAMAKDGVVYSASDEPANTTAPAVPQRSLTGKAASLAIDPIKGIEQELLSKWNAIHSLSSKLETYLHSKTKEHEVTTKGMGIRDSLKKDGKMLVRSTFGNSIKIEIKDEDPPIRQTGQRVVKVFDGDYLYVQVSTHDGTTATKEVATPESFMAVGGPGLVAVLRGVQKLRRLPDIEVEGRSMYVFRGYRPMTVKVEYMIDQETGLLHSIKRESRTLDRTRTFKFTSHEINPDFPEDHFTFTPAEGVVVEDRTKTTGASPTEGAQP